MSRILKRMSLENYYSQKETIKDVLYDSYLQKTLCKFLPQIMNLTSCVQPQDPIDYIASQLYKAQESQTYTKERLRYLADLREKQAAVIEAATEIKESKVKTERTMDIKGKRHRFLKALKDASL